MKKTNRFQKLSKLINNPNMFFYDMFRKRAHRDILPTTHTENSKSPNFSEQLHFPLIDITEVLKIGPTQYLRKHLAAGIGGKDGKDKNSLVVWSGYLSGIVNFIGGMKESMTMDVSIYTVGGTYSYISKSSDKFEARALARHLQRKTDFVVELSNGIGLLYTLHFYLYDINSAGIANIRSNRAWIKKCAATEIPFLYSKETNHAPARTIDAVYTWVNHADLKWQKLWQTSFPKEEFDPDRYTSNDELKYSLRSLNKFAPWINRIYIVTNCSKPDWLFEHDKIVWVSHEEIFPQLDMLPSFNSHAIETCLHRIENLSEHFLYLNDDVIFNSPCLPSDFYDDNGRSLSFFEPYGMVDASPYNQETPDYLVAAKNSKSLLKQTFPNYEARTLHRHVAFALKRSVLSKIEETYPDAFQTTRYAKRRSKSDVNVTSFLYHHYSYPAGLSLKGDISGIIVRPNNVEAIATTDSFKFKVLCFNDGNGSSKDNKYKSSTLMYFNKRLPEKAPWETTQGQSNRSQDNIPRTSQTP